MHRLRLPVAGSLQIGESGGSGFALGARTSLLGERITPPEVRHWSPDVVPHFRTVQIAPLTGFRGGRSNNRRSTGPGPACPRPARWNNHRRGQILPSYSGV